MRYIYRQARTNPRKEVNKLECGEIRGMKRTRIWKRVTRPIFDEITLMHFRIVVIQISYGICILMEAISYCCNINLKVKD